MKLEEVLPALRALQVVNCDDGETVTGVACFGDLALMSPAQLMCDGWSVQQKPATDEELAAAFEARADTAEHLGDGGVARNLRLAADMVRKRYVDPSWKVGK